MALEMSGLESGLPIAVNVSAAVEFSNYSENDHAPEGPELDVCTLR